MKRAIIIGASSGIGRALAKILTDNHYKVGYVTRGWWLIAMLLRGIPQRILMKL